MFYTTQLIVSLTCRLFQSTLYEVWTCSHCMWTLWQNQHSGHIFKELSHLSISMFFIEKVQPRCPTPSSPLRLGVNFECQPVTRMSSPIIPSDRWKENPMETGHYQPSFLKRKKKGFSFNCNIVLLPAAISLLSEGDIVCEPNWSFRRHLNPRLCSKSPPFTSYGDFSSSSAYFFFKKTIACQFLWQWHMWR